MKAILIPVMNGKAVVQEVSFPPTAAVRTIESVVHAIQSPFQPKSTKQLALGGATVARETTSLQTPAIQTIESAALAVEASPTLRISTVAQPGSRVLMFC